VNILQLFPISLYMGKVTIDPDVQEHLKSLKQTKEYVNETINSAGEIVHVGNLSTDKKVLDHDICAPLQKQVLEQIHEFVNDYYHVVFDGLNMHRSWVLEHQPGHWGQPHTHTNSMLSGVMYMEMPENAGNILFHKPGGYHNYLNSDTVRLSVTKNDYYNSDRWFLEPAPGLLLIFPSQTTHSIGVNQSTQSRWSLSFDCLIDGYVDDLSKIKMSLQTIGSQE